MTEAMQAGAARRRGVLLALALGALIVFFLSVSLGAVRVDLGTVWRLIFSGAQGDAGNALIILKIRLPRALATVLGGAALAISGVLLQTYFANPIVEPYVLGVSSGASLFVALVMLGGFTFGAQRMTPIFLFLGAFAGALLVMLVVLFASKRVKSMVTLLVVGLMAGYLCSAVTNILTAFAEKEMVTGYVIWSMGSFAGFTWPQIGLLAAISIPFMAISLLMVKPLDALLMGDRYAETMGIDIRRTRRAIILVSSVLTAAVTAFAGPVSFIGLAVPHMCRVLLRTSQSRTLLPAAALMGAALTGLCDLAARTVIAPVELPLGAITAIIGAPIVVYLLTRRNEGL